MSRDLRVDALLGAVSFTDASRRERLDQAASPDYWRALNPAMHVCGAPGISLTEAHPLDADGLAVVMHQLEHSGYLQAPQVLGSDDVERLRTAILRLRAAGWPPAFAFVYDEFWDWARTPSVERLLTAALGPGYRGNALVWGFYIEPRPGVTGWTPHCDGGPDPVNRLNLWFPLSDATLDNGCICAVPQGDLPETVAQRKARPEIPWDDMRRTLQAARPLPAAAGTLLGWRFHVLHWASTVRLPTAPRISVSLEFLGADVTPPSEELPVIGAQRPSTLALRLYCVAKSLQRFEKGEPLLVRYLDIARGLIERYRPADGTI